MPDRYTEYIQRVPRFANLNAVQLNRLVKEFQVRSYRVGEIIFEQGEPTAGLYIFVQGQGVLLRTREDGQRQTLGMVQAGQYLNQEALFKGGMETATLQAVRDTTLLFLSREAMANLLTYNSDFAGALGVAAQPKRKHNDTQFQGKRENETVLLYTQRHWWAYVRWMWLPLGFGVALFGLALFAPFTLLWVVLGILIPGIGAAYLYFEWANDAIIITDQRVVRITRNIIQFSEVISEIDIESVQEANAEIPRLDPFALILRYGSVEIKTAGREGNFILDFVPKPEDIQDIILEDARQTSARQEVIQQQALRADVERWISGQNPSAIRSQQVENGDDAGAAPDPAEKAYSEGSGPLSPFVTHYQSTTGGTVFRRHWFVWARRVATPMLILIGAIVLGSASLFAGNIGLIGVFIALVSFLIGAIWFYYVDWDWRHDYYILNDTQITINHQRPLWLQSENDQLLLKQVDNVIAESSGVLERILGFGDIKIALVGADELKVFDNVPNPRFVQEEISRRREKVAQQAEQQQRDQNWQLVGDAIALYHQTVNEGGQVGAAPLAVPSLHSAAPDALDQPGQVPAIPRTDGSRPALVPRRTDVPQVGPTISPARPVMNSQAGYYSPQGQAQPPNYSQGNTPPQGYYPPQGQQAQPPNYSQGNTPPQGYYPPQVPQAQPPNYSQGNTPPQGYYPPQQGQAPPPPNYSQGNTPPQGYYPPQGPQAQPPNYSQGNTPPQGYYPPQGQQAQPPSYSQNTPPQGYYPPQQGQAPQPPSYSQGNTPPQGYYPPQGQAPQPPNYYAPPPHVEGYTQPGQSAQPYPNPPDDGSSQRPRNSDRPPMVPPRINPE